MKVTERFQEVELETSRQSEQETLDRMAGRLFRAQWSQDSTKLVLSLVPDTASSLSQVEQNPFSLTSQ